MTKNKISHTETTLIHNVNAQKWVFYSSCIICSAIPTKISSVVGGHDATHGASLHTIWFKYHVSVYTSTMWKCNM